MSKHTPGPWTFVFLRKNIVIESLSIPPVRDRRPILVSLRIDARPAGEQIENATRIVQLLNKFSRVDNILALKPRLIAAAPELLDAVKIAAEAFKNNPEWNCPNTLDRLLDAIAKAENGND